MSTLLLTGVGPSSPRLTPAMMPGYVDSPLVGPLLTSGGLWQDAAKTTPATADTNPIRVLDAGANDYVAPSDAARPLLFSEGSGKWSAAFDGVDDIVSIAHSAGIAFTAGGSWSFMTRFRTGGTLNTSVLMSLADGAVFHSFFLSDGACRIQNNVGQQATLGTLAINTWYTLAMWVNANTLFGQLDAGTVFSVPLTIGWTAGNFEWMSRASVLSIAKRSVGFTIGTALWSDAQRAGLRTYFASLSP